MANKHSRQGLALGVSLALGVTTLGVLPAQAVDYENLELTIAADDTNGVLATTMENDFELELEWDISDASDLAHLKYEVTFMSSDESPIDAKGSATGISWDAADDDIDVIAEFDYFDNNAFPHEGSDIISAPAHIIGDDAVVDYTRTVTIASESGTAANLVCSAGSDVIEAADSNNPPTSYTYRLNVNRFDDVTDPDSDADEYSWTKSGGTVVTSDNSAWTAGATSGEAVCPPAAAGEQSEGQDEDRYRDYNVTYSAGTGYAGSLDAPAPSSFESVIWLESVSSVDDYVDVVVEAWLDKDGDNVKDSTESYAAPVTVRFWNQDVLTPALQLEDDGKVWYEAAEALDIEYTVYLTQELNDNYTTVLTNVNDQFAVLNDINYANTRDGSVYTAGLSDASPNRIDDLTAGWKFDDQTGAALADYQFSNKHLFVQPGSTSDLDLDRSAVNRVSVVDFNEMTEDSFFPGDGVNVSEIVAGPLAVSFVQRTVLDAVALPVEGELVIAASGNAYESDSYAHESATQVQYVISLLDTDVTNWSEFGTAEDAPAGVPTVDVTINGSYSGNTDMGALGINGTSILDATSDATKVAGDFEFEATANSAGQIVVTLAVASPSSALSINLTEVEVQGATYALDDVDANAANINFQYSEWYLVDELNAEDSSIDGADSVRTVAVGASTTIKYNVRDQFMRAPANGTARVVFLDEDYLSAERTYDGYFDSATVSNGEASIVLPDADPTSVEGSVDIVAILETKNALGAWDSYWWDEDYTRIEYVTDATVAEIDQTKDTATDDISYNDFMTVNSELVRWTAAMETIYQMQIDEAEGNYDYIDGYVRNADGLGLAGVKVTASGVGLQFMDELDWQLYGVDSLTIFTDETGYYAFEIQGHTVGEHIVTITAGGKSATATYEVTDDNVRAHNVAITSPFAAKAGTADTLTALVTDRYGNTMTAGETVTFTKVSGSGYIQEEDGTGLTDEDGVATATLIVLSGEVGFNSTVRAAITQDDFAATSNSAAAQRSAGDTNVGKTTAWTKLQADGTAKMYAKNIVGAGKVQFFHNGKEIAWVRAADALNPKLASANGAFYLVRTVELVAGKNVLEVYIDGEKVRRTAYSK